jgi:hypothetical protein
MRRWAGSGMHRKTAVLFFSSASCIFSASFSSVFSGFSLDTAERTETRLTYSKHTIGVPLTRHSYWHRAITNLASFAEPIASISSSVVISALRIEASMFLGGRSFSSDINTAHSAFPFAVSLPRAFDSRLWSRSGHQISLSRACCPELCYSDPVRRAHSHQTPRRTHGHLDCSRNF